MELDCIYAVLSEVGISFRVAETSKGVLLLCCWNKVTFNMLWTREKTLWVWHLVSEQLPSGITGLRINIPWSDCCIGFEVSEDDELYAYYMQEMMDAKKMDLPLMKKQIHFFLSVCSSSEGLAL